jgi:hypothetical protein
VERGELDKGVAVPELAADRGVEAERDGAADEQGVAQPAQAGGDVCVSGAELREHVYEEL